MVVAAMKHMASNFAKLDKFEGVDFRRWQKKMHVLLSSISVVYVLTIPIPKNDGDDATMEQIRKKAKWDNDHYVCRGLILNGTITINRGLIQAIPTSLPPQPIGEATKASNLRRIPPGVQGRSHFTYFLYLIVQITNPIFLDYRVTLGFGSTGGLDLACPINRLPCHDGIQWVLGRITNSLPGVGTDRSPHKSLDT
ncbi:hypothetical protein Tco_0259730 [Tanacetum coccineum]